MITKNEYIAGNCTLNKQSITNVLTLLNDGATIPFIARYRKEATQGLDEVEIGTIRDLGKKYDELKSRQETILTAISEQNKLTAELKERILSTYDAAKLEDLYLPYKQKKSSKAEIARKNGLEPLAKLIMSQKSGDPVVMAERFLKGDITEPEDAIQGAQHIIAEWMNESENLRERLRSLFRRNALISTSLVKGKEEEGEKYKDYFDHSELLKRCPSHRFLALYRGNREGILRMKARPEDVAAVELLERFFVRGNGACSEVVRETCTDAYKRLLRPSLEKEVLNEAKEKADEDAIRVFGKNLRQLLLAPPIGNKRILAIDPGFRTGCKVVCLDETGQLRENTTIYPHPPQNDAGKAKSKIAQLVQAHNIEAIAIGDGTAGRETERLIKSIRFDRDVNVFVVREDGASIYSASPIARKEFPDYDVTVRGAVSIGRRLMDPLAELVKIDPKSIGVGQYQHEVNQTRLKEALDDVVISCVNQVGVDVNTASPYLLSYVSGLGQTLAENIVEYRSEKGRIESRKELLNVKRLGDKAFEQSAGFLRVRDGVNPLDNSAVHPESYGVVEKMAKKLGMKVTDLIGKSEVLDKLNIEQFPEIDDYTFTDIVGELKKPGRDPRNKARVLEFDHRLKTIDDLKPGMTISGIVTNVTNFGAFVNIGIKENGLIHKSNLTDGYVEDPSDYIALHDHVSVQVLEVDPQRKRIGLKRIH